MQYSPGKSSGDEATWCVRHFSRGRPIQKSYSAILETGQEILVKTDVQL
jgi:hypothetical protein